MRFSFSMALLNAHALATGLALSAVEFANPEAFTT